MRAHGQLSFGNFVGKDGLGQVLERLELVVCLLSEFARVGEIKTINPQRKALKVIFPGLLLSGAVLLGGAPVGPNSAPSCRPSARASRAVRGGRQEGAVNWLAREPPGYRGRKLVALDISVLLRDLPGVPTWRPGTDTKIFLQVGLPG